MPMSPRTRNECGRASGFTLIELLIVITIVAILAAVAVPSYRQHVVRSKRSAAQAIMMDIASREQQFLFANRSYADKAALVASGFVVPAEVSENYTWDVVTPAPTDADPVPKFTITFTGSGAQATDGALALTEKGHRTPAEKWKR
jgi:type IV pilus assembly protein PilE